MKRRRGRKTSQAEPGHIICGHEELPGVRDPHVRHGSTTTSSDLHRPVRFTSSHRVAQVVMRAKPHPDNWPDSHVGPNMGWRDAV